MRETIDKRESKKKKWLPSFGRWSVEREDTIGGGSSGEREDTTGVGRLSEELDWDRGGLLAEECLEADFM